MLLVGVILQACATLPRLAAVPPALTDRAAIPGIPNARFWLDGDLAPFIQSVVHANRLEAEALAKAGIPNDPMPPVTLLAISGGGDSGAFAAGLLGGWTAHGDRPEFTVVTGVSAGALIAPFAFLGSRYDDVLRKVSTSVAFEDIFHQHNVLIGLSRDGMADSEPLSRLIAKYLTAEVLAEIGREFSKGRALLIGTTDLDSGRPVTWDMGAIAASGAPGALELFRKIVLASSSIPVVVSPVMIDVEVNGQHFQEMHVDGGVINQVFLYPATSVAEMSRVIGKPFRREIRIFVIRNGRLEPEWIESRRRTLRIGARAIGMLIQTQGISDLSRIYLTARQDKAVFNLAYIDSGFNYPHNTEFETEYMRRLFDYSYELSSHGYPWHKTPPSVDSLPFPDRDRIGNFGDR